MLRGINSRVLGSGLIGLALVCSAWVLNSLGSGPGAPQTALYVASNPPPERNIIDTSDANTDGVEDWKEPFLTAAPVILTTATSAYARENTLTEQVSINLMESMLMAQSFGAAGANTEQIVQNSTKQAFLANEDKIYTTRDITVDPNTDAGTVKDYANTVAIILATHDVKGSKNELLLLDEAVRTDDPKLYEAINKKAEMYRIYRDELLKLPVPTTLVSEHLALINVFNAFENNLRAMTEINTDPLKSLVRLRRYQDDSAALVSALRGFYLGISRYSLAFTAADPAIAFTAFGKIQQP